MPVCFSTVWCHMQEVCYECGHTVCRRMKRQVITNENPCGSPLKSVGVLYFIGYNKSYLTIYFVLAFCFSTKIYHVLPTAQMELISLKTYAIICVRKNRASRMKQSTLSALKPVSLKRPLLPCIIWYSFYTVQFSALYF